MCNERTLSLRELQLTELDILVKFDEFCTKNEIKYTLVGGTLLGAVRHKGFIPWDDDIDVGMPRPEYEKFYGLLRENDFVLPGTRLKIIPDRGNEAVLPFLKLIDPSYCVHAKEAVGSDNVWIDILPIDGYPDTEKKTKKFCKKLKMYRHIMVYNTRGAYKRKKGILRIIAILFTLYARIYGKKRVFKKMSRLIDKYPFGNTCFAGVATWGLYGTNERVPIPCMEKQQRMLFEGHEFLAMNGWDLYLSQIYGDYMTPLKWSHGTEAAEQAAKDN